MARCDGKERHAFSRDKCFDKVRSAPQFVQFMTQLKPVWERYERQMR